THTPLQPMDALCELIDNALDSFQVARLAAEPVEFPKVAVELPGAAEADRGEGAVRIRDNGPGLSPEFAENALRAGFSGKNRYDTLGLFGMGLKMATARWGWGPGLWMREVKAPKALGVVSAWFKVRT